MATRDFRVQMRGSRSVVLFGMFLAILILVAVLNYNNVAGSRVTVREAQQDLGNFYGTLIAILALTVCAVSPGLTATAIVTERQRKSLDLVFCAPVSARYYLVGKLIASYRYVWMLLALSLPITASCVVLGGASWTDVLLTYLVISVDALVLTSMALLVSAVVAKPIAGILWTYACVIAFELLTLPYALLAGQGVEQGQSSMFQILLNPLTVPAAIGTVTRIGTTDVPNWVLAILFGLAIAWVFLRGASSALSPYDDREARTFRLSALALLAAFGLVNGWYFAVHSSAGAVGALRLQDRWPYWSMALVATLLPVALLAPFFVCYGADTDRKYRDDGWFGLRSALTGTASGGLVYLVLCVAAGFGGATFGSNLRGGSLVAPGYAAWLVGFVVAIWGMGRLMSSFNIGLRSARGMVAIAMALAFVAPFLTISSLAAAVPEESRGAMYDFSSLRPALTGATNPHLAYTHAAILAGAGILLALLGDGWIKRVTADKPQSK